MNHPFLLITVGALGTILSSGAVHAQVQNSAEPSTPQVVHHGSGKPVPSYESSPSGDTPGHREGPAGSEARRWYVDAGAEGQDTGTDWANALTDVQGALATAEPGDHIWVAAGTYTPSDTDAAASFVLQSGVELYGGFGGWETQLAQRDPLLNETTLSGDIGRDDVLGSGPSWYVNWNIHSSNSGHVIVANGVDATAVVDGFTIAQGHTGPSGTPANSPLTIGSGLYIEGGSPTVRNCLFRHHLAGWGSGAAVFVWNGSPVIQNCTFLSNYVHIGQGAGIAVWGTSDPLIEDCLFKWNRCVGSLGGEAAGGGIWNRSELGLTVARCTFEANTVTNFWAEGDDVFARGAGIGSLVSPHLTVRDCVFKNNWAHAGAGIYTWHPATLVNCLFVDNTAESYNGEFLSLGDFGAGVASVSGPQNGTELINCTLVGNQAGEGAGVYGAGNHPTVLRNCIVWGNTATGEEVTPLGAQVKGSVDILFSCVQDLLTPVAGEDPPNPDDFPGSIDADPLLLDVAGGNLHLASGSPCIDAGNNDDVPLDVTLDLDGLPRFLDDPATPDSGVGDGPLVDMGAYEFQD